MSSRQCAFSSEKARACMNMQRIPCETGTSGKQMICGGDVFCLDGECDKATSGKSNDFGQAVSELAALAAAGKDVAALNGVDVRAFTGKAKFCKKFAAGFSNCCKDSGWGEDVGLARCSSEERRWPKRKRQADGQYRNSALKGSGDLHGEKGAIASSTQNWRRSFSSREETVSCISVLAAPAS
nr:conjugal transfer protein TraN [Klebsiella pneumoniae]